MIQNKPPLKYKYYNEYKPCTCKKCGMLIPGKGFSWPLCGDCNEDFLFSSKKETK